MKRFWIFLLGFFVSLEVVGAQVENFSEISIPLRDGKALSADLYLPELTGKYPTILIITPYNRKLFRTITVASMKSVKAGILDRSKYVYVVADWRGFFGSTAASTGKGPFAARLAGQDGYDTVEWIATQSWSNGKVGMWGASALGKVQFMTAIEKPPHLTCIAPSVMDLGNGYHKYYHGGIFKRGRTENQERAGWKGTVAMATAQPLKTMLWQVIERNSWKELTNIEVPVLMIGGWYDLETEGLLETFQKLREQGSTVAQKETRLILGPWDHNGTSQGKKEVGDLSFPEAEHFSSTEGARFFDYWLREQKDNGWDKTPAVQWFQMGENVWKKTTSLKTISTTPQIFYFGESRQLQKTLPQTEGKTTFVADPHNPSPTIGGMNLVLPGKLGQRGLAAGPKDQREEVESRPDVLSWTSEVLSQPFPMCATVELTLFLESDQKDTDVVVRLCDVYPDGRSMLVTDGAQRLSLRNSLNTPEWLEKGKIYSVTVRLSVTAHTFQTGHQIRVLVSGSNYPRFDINPNNGESFFSSNPEPVKATNILHHSPKSPSQILFYVLKE